MLPISINGLGLRESAAVALYTSPAIGLPLAVAVLIPTVGFACEMFVSAWGGLFFLARKGGLRNDITVEEANREDEFYAKTGGDPASWSVPKRGAILGFGAGSLLGKTMEWAVSFSPSAAIIAFATSAGIGVVFGYFPARRAAHLDPIQALRHE